MNLDLRDMKRDRSRGRMLAGKGGLSEYVRLLEYHFRENGHYDFHVFGQGEKIAGMAKRTEVTDIAEAAYIHYFSRLLQETFDDSLLERMRKAGASYLDVTPPQGMGLGEESSKRLYLFDMPVRGYLLAEKHRAPENQVPGSNFYVPRGNGFYLPHILGHGFELAHAMHVNGHLNASNPIGLSAWFSNVLERMKEAEPKKKKNRRRVP